MKQFKLLTLVALAVFGFISCSKEEAPKQQEAPKQHAVKSKKIENLHAPQKGGHGGAPATGKFIKFDFSTGLETNSNRDWDIAFRGSTIIVNGGVKSGATEEPERSGNAAVYIAKKAFAAVKEVNTSSLKQDKASTLAIPTGSGNGWYNYDMKTHSITPIAGRTLVFRTRDGKYAKMEILSYYKDMKPESDEIGEVIQYGVLFGINIALVLKEKEKWKHLLWIRPMGKNIS
ncbi:HmuY protein [Elysia marginata]|uniref:HmuY protein n=1 Tax=Elysia marginata TaxID=1093978 RepID=A0AAV4G5P7_9GAST|nr:HmuY protein [Elysia marginata]